jgi:hypothetical protein
MATNHFILSTKFFQHDAGNLDDVRREIVLLNCLTQV